MTFYQVSMAGHSATALGIEGISRLSAHFGSLFAEELMKYVWSGAVGNLPIYSAIHFMYAPGTTLLMNVKSAWWSALAQSHKYLYPTLVTALTISEIVAWSLLFNGGFMGFIAGWFYGRTGDNPFYTNTYRSLFM
jgi:hypothetical protein